MKGNAIQLNYPILIYTACPPRLKTAANTSQLVRSLVSIWPFLMTVVNNMSLEGSTRIHTERCDAAEVAWQFSIDMWNWVTIRNHCKGSESRLLFRAIFQGYGGKGFDIKNVFKPISDWFLQTLRIPRIKWCLLLRCWIKECKPRSRTSVFIFTPQRA